MSHSDRSALRALCLATLPVAVLPLAGHARDGTGELVVDPARITERSGAMTDTVQEPRLAEHIAADYPDWTLVGTLTGSFTRPATSQTLAFLVDAPPLPDTPAASHATRLVIFDGDGTAEITPDLRGTVLGPVIPGGETHTDLLVLGDWFMRQGVESLRIKVLSLEGGAAEVLHDVPEAWVSTCREDGSGRIEGVTLTFEAVDAQPQLTPFTLACRTP